MSLAWRQDVERLWKHNNPEVRERERIAAVLHDDFGQCLVVIGLMLDRLSTDDVQQRQACIDDIRTVLVRLDQSWRRAVFVPDSSSAQEQEEAPEMLPALIQLCNEAERALQLHCSLQTSVASARPTTRGSRVLLLGVSELLLNARKHAGSPCVDIRVESHGPWVEVAVRDHGRTHPESFLERGSRRGFGLTNLKHELRLVGGDMRVEAVAPGRKVRLRVPAQSPMRAAQEGLA